jgi:pimeloyl-ACP methyl ester carboxylesterase
LKAAVGVEEAMQIIRLLPPIYAEKVDPAKLNLDLQANGQNYHVRLPAGYHHGRAWPVMIVLHHSQEKPAEAAARWADLAGQHGYILAAPTWSKNLKATYGFTGAEHMAVLETIKDLRLRFNVDSDRIFLYGGEQGGNMAFDVASGHPDQFAGVIPMAGTPQYFVNKCWANTQYLPFYVVNGELANIGSKFTLSLFKDFWIKGNFPSIYVEYKGRPAEWFGAEQRIVFDWMNRKRRANPQKFLGSEDLEFKTSRRSDKQFYWLSIEDVQPNHVNSASQWISTMKPAMLTARVISASNEIQVKTSGVVGPVTIWFGPKLVNYGEKVKVRINDRTAGTQTIVPTLEVLLPVLYQTGDRERMVFARMDLRP